MDINYKRAVLKNKNENHVIEQAVLSTKENHSIVEISYAALNHRDYWIGQGLYPGIILPATLGSDGAGYVGKKKVLINPNIDWGKNPLFPGPEYNILGLEHDGTFASHVQVHNNRLHDIPEHMTMEEAAALPLAGLTAYRALVSKCKIQSGEKVLITGIGGGVAQMAMQFAIALGAEVYISSSDPTKIEKAISLGAVGGGNYKKEMWYKDFKTRFGQVDVVIDGASGKGFKDLISLTKRGGRIAVYGGTNGKIQEINPAHLFFKQLSIFGSTMGNDTEFSNMLSLVSEKQIVPIIDRVFHLTEINEAIQYMKSGNHFGKIVINPR